jgi:hypothetical protein
VKRSLALALAVSVVLASFVVEAQSSRPGIRLSLTRVEAMGGFTASGFLVVQASRIVRTPAPECGAGAVRIDAAGRDASGRIRGAHLVVIASPVSREVSFGVGACDATLAIELEDGTTLSPEHGAITVQLVGAGGIDATIAGSSVGESGVATTIAGHVVLPSG